MASILIMDDNQDHAEIMQQALEFEGHDVVVTESYGTAMQALEGQMFDLLVTDLHVPATEDGTRGGVTLITDIKLARTRGDLSGGNFPIMVITGMLRAMRQSTNEALARGLGVDAVLQKPFDLKEFIDLVAELTGSPDPAP